MWKWRVIAGIVAAIMAASCSSSSSSGGSALDQRTCEIGRDIAGSFNVTDTLEESRKRVADLYDGYGQSASGPIAAAIRQWVQGMTTGDYDSAAQGVKAFDTACGAEGF
jgi:hypothetical protein